VICCDEAGIQLDPTIHAQWAGKGSQPEILTKSRRERVNISGWTDLKNFDQNVIKIERGNSKSFIDLLLDIEQKNSKYKKIYIFADNAKWHKSKEVFDFLKEHSKIVCDFFPKYSPKLNPQEKQWWWLRYIKTHGERFEDSNECWKEIEDHFKNLPKERVKSLCQLI